MNAMSRETILRQYLDTIKGQYSHILIDCQPSWVCSRSTPCAGRQQGHNPRSGGVPARQGPGTAAPDRKQGEAADQPQAPDRRHIADDGDNRTNFAKEIAALLRETYGSKIKVFGTEIPHSVRAKEISAEGKSIFAHDPNGKVAEGYKNLTQEVIKLEKQREKSRAWLHTMTCFHRRKAARMPSWKK